MQAAVFSHAFSLSAHREERNGIWFLSPHTPQDWPWFLSPPKSQNCIFGMQKEHMEDGDGDPLFKI